MTKILVADDDALLRRGIYFVLQDNGSEVCGDAENKEDAVNKVVELKPDLVLLNATPKGKVDVFAVGRQIRQVAPSVKIMVLGLFDTPEIAQ
jgi:two-component system response regulator NreC